MNDSLTQLADIYLPPPPDWTLAYVTLALSAIVTAAVIIGLLWRDKRRRPLVNAVTSPPISHIQQQLDELNALWQQNAVSSRDAAYRLATIMRRHCGLTQLTPQRPHQFALNESQWRNIIEELNAKRYQQDHDPSGFDPALLERVRSCLTPQRRS